MCILEWVANTLLLPKRFIATLILDAKRRVGEDRFYLAYTSIFLFLIEGRWDGNLRSAGPWRRELMPKSCRGLFIGLLIMARPACLCIEPPKVDDDSVRV